MITENQLNSIVYESASKQEVTERVIVPVYVPSDNIKAIDVTDLPGNERVEMLELMKQYKEYQDAMRANTFNFETWVEHTTGKSVTPKWRTFTINRILSEK